MLETFISNPIYLTIIALLGAMIFITLINANYFASFKLLFLRRWLRLIFAALLGGEILAYFFPENSIETLYVVGALLYFLGESALYWYAVSYGDWAEELAQRFKKSDVSWSAQARHIKLKDKIEELGFSKSGSFEEKIFGEPTYVTTFDSADKLTRISVYFVTAAKSTYMLSSVESMTNTERRIITQSRCMPNCLEHSDCEVRFVALESNPLRLLKIHNKRISKIKSELVAMPQDPLADLNAAIDRDIKANQKSGILNPINLWDEEGVFTDEGKYSCWKDLILANYLPFVK